VEEDDRQPFPRLVAGQLHAGSLDDDLSHLSRRAFRSEDRALIGLGRGDDHGREAADYD
jgi:hypothetical protein